MFDREKAMTDAVDAIARLDWNQLVVLNAQLGEHMFNCLQHAQVQKLKEDRRYGTQS